MSSSTINQYMYLMFANFPNEDGEYYKVEEGDEIMAVQEESPQISLNALNGSNSFQTTRITRKIGKHEGEVNPTHAYYNGSGTSKYNKDPSWSTIFKTKRTQKTSLALEDFICVVFVPVSNIVNEDGEYYKVEEGDEIMPVQEESPQISLNALNGSNSFQTTRITRKIGKHEVHILVDCGATHNFLDVNVAKQVGCKIKSICLLVVNVGGWMILVSDAVWKNFEWDVFAVRTDLPPKRTNDHKIPLLPNTQPVNIRPYRHPSMQKDAIETIVNELLDSGVIKPSKSPFASPIVMVKKKDNT
nr:reverse transcriptase [Tanacetum cinerariifolium]